MSRYQTRQERFLAKVDDSDELGCWLWTGSRTTQGYGVLRTGPREAPKAEYAHRLAWEFLVSEIPDGQHVLHHCDNPPCVNPGHLFLGSQGDNMRDMAGKGRTGHHGKLTPEVVRSIRQAIGTNRGVAARFGISEKTVRDVRGGVTWKSVA